MSENKKMDANSATINLSTVHFGRITKLPENDRFEGKHPNGFNPGFERTGIIQSFPKFGESFVGCGITTSTVTEIIEASFEKIVFRTLNSTYELVATPEIMTAMSKSSETGMYPGSTKL